MINKVILVGNLGKDPELKTTQGGKSVATFSLATSFGADKVTEWHNIVVWEKLADNVARFLHKGSKVFVEGRLQTRSYEKDGVKRYMTEIVANDVKFLDSKPAEGEGRQPPFAGGNEQISASDDLPF